jgi:hypothetical protein
MEANKVTVLNVKRALSKTVPVMVTAALLTGWAMATVMVLIRSGAVTCLVMVMTMVTAVILAKDALKALCKTVPMKTVALPLGWAMATVMAPLNIGAVT